jgi:hypothetical protein
MVHEIVFKMGMAGADAFKNAITGPMGMLTQFIQRTLSVGNIWDRIWSNIERGEALVNLSKRTGMAVRDIYLLQEAFKFANLDAGAATGALNKMQMALAGTGEQGKAAAKAFSELGLSPAVLKKMSAAEANTKILQALSEKDHPIALRLSRQIYGREGGQNMVQISRDMRGFSESMEIAARGADIFARSAMGMAALQDEIKKVKYEMELLFVRLAAIITPIMGGLLQAIKEGKLGEALIEIFNAAWQSILTLAPPVFEYLKAMLVEWFGKAFPILSTLWNVLVIPLDAFLNKLRLLLWAIQSGLENIKAVWNGLKGIAGFDVDKQSATDKAKQGVTSAFGNLEAIWSKVMSRFNVPINGKPPGSLAQEATSFNNDRMNALEKIGFMFSSVGQMNYAQETAKNTRIISDTALKIETLCRMTMRNSVLPP